MLLNQETRLPFLSPNPRIITIVCLGKGQRGTVRLPVLLSVCLCLRVSCLG